jgi:hypothetical protein
VVGGGKDLMLLLLGHADLFGFHLCLSFAICVDNVVNL